MMGDVNEESPSEQPVQEIDQVSARRAELLAQAREATVGRPDLARLVEEVEGLDTVDLAHHAEVLDGVHRSLREALSAAGRDDAPAP